MKGRRAFAGWAICGLVPAACVLLSSCGLFLARQRDRENPLDPDAVVAVVQDFAAAATAVDTANEPDTVTVTLTWTKPDVWNAPSGIVIAWSERDFPTSIGDALSSAWADAATGSWEHTGLEQNKVLYYSAWSESGDTYVGPVHAIASTYLPVGITDLVATALSEDTVQLTWSPPVVEQPLVRILMVRKESTADPPTGPSDGTLIGIDPARGAFTDTGLTASRTYGYAAWGVNGKLLSGAASDFANTTISDLVLFPVIDGYVSSYGEAEFASTTMDTSGSSWYTAYGLLRFPDPPSQVLQASLTLRSVGVPPSFVGTAARVAAQPWNESVPYATVAEAAFVDASDAALVTLASLTVWDVTDLVRAWAAGKPNYGIRISVSSTSTVTFSTVEAPAGSEPTLAIRCSEEFH